MRTAEDIVRDYRARGYNDERLRALANGRPEPVRSEIIALLEVSSAEEVVDEPVAAAEESSVPAATEESAAVVSAEQIVELSFEEDDEESVSAVQEESAIFSADEVGAEIIEIQIPEEELASQASPADDQVDIMEQTAAEENEDVLASIDVEVNDDVLASVDREIEEDKTPDTPEAREVPVYKLDSTYVRKVEESLATIEVVRMTQSEFLSTSELVEETPLSTTNDLAEENLSEDIFLPQGELWPSVEEVKAAEESQAIGQAESEVYLVFDEEVESFETMKHSKAAQRSIDIIQKAIMEEPELAGSLHNESNIISLSPPYATDDIMYDEVEDVAGEQVLVEKDESGLIKFPHQMIDSYNAILSTRESNNSEALVTMPKSEEDRNATEVEEVAAVPEYSAADTEAIETEISTLRNWLAELEDAINMKDIENNAVVEQLQERDKALTLMSEELARMQNQVEDDTAVSASLDEARSELASLQKTFVELEREYNILSTGTVPDLQNDKDDLLEMLEQQSVTEDTLRATLNSNNRRMTVSYTLAAAASLMVVLLPILHWVQSGAAKTRFETAHKQAIARAEQAERLADAHKQKAFELSSASKVAKLEAENWQKKYRTQRSLVEKKMVELAQAKQKLRTQGLPNPQQVALDNRRTANGGAPIQQNDIRDPGGEIRRHLARNRRTAPTAATTTQYGTVQKREGISHVLWRKLGTSNKIMETWVAKKNNLKWNSRGKYWIVQPGQKLIIPKKASNSKAELDRAIGSGRLFAN